MDNRNNGRGCVMNKRIQEAKLEAEEQGVTVTDVLLAGILTELKESARRRKNFVDALKSALVDFVNSWKGLDHS